MTVKSERGRRRYIAFEIGPDVSKNLLSRTVSDIGQHIRIISHGKGMAVIRCSPSDSERVIGKVESSFPGSRSVRASGTLRSLRDRYSSLEKERKPPSNPKKDGH